MSAQGVLQRGNYGRIRGVQVPSSLVGKAMHNSSIVS